MKNAILNSPASPRASRKGLSAVRYLLGAAFCVLGLMSPASAQIDLVFGTYTADKPTTTVKTFKPFLNYLAEEMTKTLGENVVITMKIAKSYDEGIDHLANGDVDFARFGPASYITVQARNPGIQIVTMESKKGQKRFKGIIAVHSDSKIQSLSDLKQQSFAFGDQLSTIGRYLSQSHLLNAGISGKDLSGYEYLGRHDRVGAAVGAGKFTAGALKESTFKKQVADGMPIRALFEFDNVTKPWLAASDLDPKVLKVMRDVMLGMGKNEVLVRIAKDGFLEGSDADYDFVRKAMKHSAEF